MMGTPLADASGAVVMAKKKFDTLPPDLQEILLRNGRKYMAELTLKSREENAASIQTLKKNGIQWIEVTDKKTLQEFQRTGKAARQSLVGTLYDQAFLDRMEKILADYRATRRGPK
jgi:TRAP-type C4-dicarboxylate transport system substrate-binding protein